MLRAPASPRIRHFRLPGPLSRFPLFCLLLLPLVAPAPAAPAGADTREADALVVLSTSTDLHARARACQDLATFATAAAVPALAALLGTEHLSDYARSALESIAGPAPDAALRAALPKLEGRFLAGVVHSLGVRRDNAAVPELKKLALDTRRGVAAEAIAALGLVANADAAKILEQLLADGPGQLKPAAAHAALAAAEVLARGKNPAAARSLLAAIPRANLSAHLTRTAQANLAALR